MKVKDEISHSLDTTPSIFESDNKIFEDAQKIKLREFLFNEFGGLINKDSRVLESMTRILIRNLDNPILVVKLWQEMIRNSSQSLSIMQNKELLRIFFSPDIGQIVRWSIMECQKVELGKSDLVSAKKIKIQASLASQKDSTVFRTLETLDTGIFAKINPKNLKQFVNEYEFYDGIIPILEEVKNEKIMDMSGYTQSKVALVVHDYFDHLRVPSYLAKSGIIDKHVSFFEEIGNPMETDMLARGGSELHQLLFSYAN